MEWGTVSVLTLQKFHQMFAKEFHIKHDQVFSDVVPIAKLHSVCNCEQSEVHPVVLLLYRGNWNCNGIEVSSIQTGHAVGSVHRELR